MTQAPTTLDEAMAVAEDAAAKLAGQEYRYGEPYVMAIALVKMADALRSLVEATTIPLPHSVRDAALVIVSDLGYDAEPDEEAMTDTCDICGDEIDGEPYILTIPMPARIACGDCASKEAKVG